MFPADVYYGSVAATAVIVAVPILILAGWEAWQRTKALRDARFYEHRYWDVVEQLERYQERDL
jgi:hypothetical protein